MASGPSSMSALTQEITSEERWQELIAWDDELYDPLFQGDIGIAATSSENVHNNSFTSDQFSAPESVASEQSYQPVIATSLFEGPSSFDYAVSGPPSVAEGQSSYGQGHSWLSGSPSYTTSATSPLVAQAGVPHQRTSEACDNMLSPLRMSTASPFFDAQSHGSSSSYQTAPTSGFFNPYVAGTPHSFSGLEIYASQALDNLGTWAEPSIDPIIEVHQEDGSGAMPINIPQRRPEAFSNTFSPHPWNTHASYQSQSSQARAITIPQLRPPNVNMQSEHSQKPSLERHPSPRNYPQPASPALSVSPEQRRLPRTAPLARSLSNPRRSRNGRLATPSPTSTAFGWVSYQPNTQKKLVPLGTEGSRRRQRGREGPLTSEQRRHAALMRHIGSCSNCKRRKEKCDPGIPCKSCLDRFKGDLVNHPCRDRLISDLAGVFLAERHGWHPTVKVIESCAGNYVVAPRSYTIPIIFGFGPPLYLPVSLVQFENMDADLYHEHMIYSWPPTASPGEVHAHAVLPAILAPQVMSKLEETLDSHLTLLVDKHFNSFPLFCSPLRILRHVYVYFRALPTVTSYSRLLRQSLKLLVLVHVGGDVTLPARPSDPVLDNIIRTHTSIPESATPTPCFIRSQFGSIMPSLALKLMQEVLRSLEQLFLTRECHEWPTAFATLLTVLMTVESIQYHATKLPYHHSHAPRMARSLSSQERDFRADDEGVRQLLGFYSACFSGCHARLSPDWQGDATPGVQPHHARSASPTPDDRFVASMREGIRNATLEYLETKASDERAADDMSYFFDRLAARLLVLKVNGGSASASQHDVS